ncbi:hypothetical protein CLV92_10951 [Kineococcus xinjiangensis]|uniref:Hydroxymethylpyrimidine pyrophosphatase-like HAD family hydrolase n=1 Tax=Kineococcus xinjiangensis TaxID=512762 RepID=A0A2S6IHW0_9ACTN|nr:hypothetical protein [Kineococcus xinjiangensis]PPK93775.1 hypothetical protein CLV92_10951 [Kineococcus xinjiangensis]
MSPVPPLGLLLDVDGPVASPATRSVSRPGILAALVELAGAGVPLVFNTGRSDTFLREQVVAPLLAAGLPGTARVHAVCEKGAVRFSVRQGRATEVVADSSLAVPREVHELVGGIVAARYADTMFVDTTKRAMVSVEQRVDVPASRYAAAQGPFEEEVLAACAAAGLGVGLRGREVPDAQGRVPYRIDPTVIAVDVESVLLGKDRGAERALELLAADGELPARWRTVGDSRTDYAMADLLHSRGLSVAHVDVRPGEGVPSRDYPVLVPEGAVEDEAGEAYLVRVAALLRGERAEEAGGGFAWWGSGASRGVAESWAPPRA